MDHSQLEAVTAGIDEKGFVPFHVDLAVDVTETALELVAVVKLHASFVDHGTPELDGDVAIPSVQDPPMGARKLEAFDVDAQRYTGFAFGTIRAVEDWPLAPVACGEALIELIGAQVPRGQTQRQTRGATG
jgi:hypothetical protein